MPAADQRSTANHLLAALSRQAYQRMLPGLKPVELNYGQVLYEPKGAIRYVHFPVNCLVSLLTSVDKARTLEVGMVGNEGMVGMPMALDGFSAVRALVQGSGTAMRMTAARFRSEFRKSPPLQRAIFRYDHFLMAQISQTAACNRFHEAEVARLARWPPTTGDRVHADNFYLTHAFLAHMLG